MVTVKIALVSIFIGRYSALWDEFFSSYRTNFSPEFDRTLFIFTNDENFLNSAIENVKFIEKLDEGWPNNSANRFKWIHEIENYLIDFDFVFFFQANSLFTSDFARNSRFNYQSLNVVRSIQFVNTHPFLRPYERNKESSAYVKFGEEGLYYYQAGGFAAPPKILIDFVIRCQLIMEIDKSQNFMAKHDDESYLNKILIDFENIYVLNHDYLFPENAINRLDQPLVIMRDKEKYFDVMALKITEKSNLLIRLIKFIIRKLYYIKLRILIILKMPFWN